MDGKGRWLHNVYVGRLWCNPEQEKVYRRAYNTVAEARKGIADYCTTSTKNALIRGLTA